MIRPAYWTDADLHLRLTPEVREFYIGLWMMADDAGYVAWDVTRVGAELYPFKTQAWRTRRMPEMLAALGPGHARLLACGKHVVVPNLARYQSPPRPSYPVQRAHDTGCPRQVAPPASSLPQVAAGGTSTGREVEGREGKGMEVGARARASSSESGAPFESEFRQRVPRP